MTRTILLSVLALAAAAAGGCRAPQPYVTPERLERGLVIVLPGIEGHSPFNDAICKGLNDGGVNWAIELHDWTSAWGPLYNLRARGRNYRQALFIADRIIRYRIWYPGRPVVLVGQSGGGAMAVWIAESLPPGQQVDGAIMIAAALSPGYMLDRALMNSRRGLINFYSARDWILLGVGTTVYGTMDGQHTTSAGRVGFTLPTAGGKPDEYDRLFQIAWQPKMADTGNLGSHLTSGADEFVAEYIAPFVLNERWNALLIAQVLNRELPENGEATSGPPTTIPATAPTPSPATAPTTTSAPATAPENAALEPE